MTRVTGVGKRLAMLGVSTADGAVRAVAGMAQTSASEKSLSLELGPHTYSSTPSSSPDGRARRAVEVAVALATPRDDVSVLSTSGSICGGAGRPSAAAGSLTLGEPWRPEAGPCETRLLASGLMPLPSRPLHALTEPVIPPRASACSPILWGFHCAFGTYWPSGVSADSLPKVD